MLQLDFVGSGAHVLGVCLIDPWVPPKQTCLRLQHPNAFQYISGLAKKGQFDVMTRRWPCIKCCKIFVEDRVVRRESNTTTSNRLLSRTPRSSSRKNTLVRTLPPASRQMRAAAVSGGNPLRPRIPATEQAERWWPKLSRRRPHTHERAVKGSGRRNLRSRRMRKGCGSIRHERSVGNTVKGIDARGPACDLNKVGVAVRKCGEQTIPELCLHDAGHGCLPPLPWLVGFLLVNHVGSLDLSRSQLDPIWGHKTCFFQVPSARVDGLDAARTVVAIHCAQNCCSHLRISLTNHLNGVRPTGPMALRVSVGHCCGTPTLLKTRATWQRPWRILKLPLAARRPEW